MLNARATGEASDRAGNGKDTDCVSSRPLDRAEQSGTHTSLRHACLLLASPGCPWACSELAALSSPGAAPCARAHVGFPE